MGRGRAELPRIRLMSTSSTELRLIGFLGRSPSYRFIAASSPLDRYRVPCALSISYPRVRKGAFMGQQANQQSWRSAPYAFFVAALAIMGACLVFGLSMWIFGDLFKNATTVIAALGSLFTLIGTIVGA